MIYKLTIESAPKVSIGLPVYNGEKYLRAAIDSILTQTFTDFELIISDNASTDSTETICKEYAVKDSRIRYYRNDKNIGGSNNHNRVFELSKGQYFQWTADDDLWDSRFLQKSVEILDREPSIVLCFSIFKTIDKDGKQVSVNDRMLGQLLQPYERLRELASMDHHSDANYGLIRSEILCRTDLELNYFDSERTLLSELGLYGRFYIIDEPLFFRRNHPERSSFQYPIYKNVSFYHPEIEDKNYFYFERWQQFLHYLKVIFRVPLTPRQRFKCCLYIVWDWVFVQGRWGAMIREVLSPIKKIGSNFITN
jgi:glycosyltransferase involved in cell wall biosynthesis